MLAPGVLVLLAGGLLLAVFCARLATSGRLTYPIGSDLLRADGFYALEQSPDGAPFRWSEPSAGFLVPALAAQQVVTLEVAAPRPPGMAPPHVTLAANGVTVPLVVAPGWMTYSISAPSQVGLENAVAVLADTFDDSFYPASGDARHLTVAVRQVDVAPAAGPGGWPWPAPLPGAVVVLLPAAAWGAARRIGARFAAVGASLASAAAALTVWLLPARVLPAALAVTGAVLALALAAACADRVNALGAAIAYRLTPGRTALALAALFLALTLVATWPLALHLDGAVPGWPGDNLQYLYKIHWMATALRTGGDLFNDPIVYYPYGFNFGRGELTLTNLLPAAGIVLLGGTPALGYNLVLIAGFVLAGLGMYGLARTVGAGRLPALLAGVVYVLAPYHLAHAGAHPPLFATQWLPITLLFAERTLQGRRLRDGMLTGLSYGLVVLTAWYYAIIGGVLLAGYVACRLLMLRRAGGRPALVRAGLLAALVAGVLLAPALPVALGAAQEAPLTYSAAGADDSSAAPQNYLTPNPIHPLWGETAMRALGDQNVYEVGLYPGWPALLLAGIAVLMYRREAGRRAGIWAGLALACFVLSLGLTLHTAGGAEVRVGGAPIPLPGQWLYRWVPGFSSLRVWARFGIDVILCLAVLAGLGLTWLLARPALGRYRLVLGASLLALVLLDFWSVPYGWGLSFTRPNAVAGWLAAQPDGVVEHLPLQRWGTPLYWGTFYGHPLAYGYDTFDPPGYVADRAVLNTFPSDAAFDLLRRRQVRYVVVMASAYGADWPGVRARYAQLPDWTPVYRALQPRYYDGPFWVGDVRPELLDSLAPNELIVYRLNH